MTVKALIACEESQTVTTRLREKGIEAYSCDIEPCSGGHPEYHLQQDVIPLLESETWDLIIAFPPCTHLCISGALYFEQKRKDGRQKQGIDFFMKFITNTKKQKRVAIENPIGIMNTEYRKPDQIINPYQFGDPFSKTTCLWLKGLPRLIPTKLVSKGEFMIDSTTRKKRPKWIHMLPPSDERSTIRSRTFPGIAQAMADQWGNIILNPEKYIFNLESFLKNI